MGRVEFEGKKCSVDELKFLDEYLQNDLGILQW